MTHHQLCDADDGIEPIRMGYLRCEACGAKALSAASQCPKCAHLFELRDARGERVALKTCRHCGIMHRRDRQCQWCADAVRPSAIAAWRATVNARTMAATAAVALVAVGGYGVVRTGGSVLERMAAAVSASASAPATVSGRTGEGQPAAATTTTGIAAGSATTEPSAQPIASSAATDTVQLASATMAALDGDTITWVPAVARTWVNVRRDAARAGDVVGVIKPSEKAMLGTGRGGWRLVKSPDVRGWVDPRLFEADSARTRG